jgi:hypothetical protein
LKGLVLAREKGRLLAWDDRDWIYHFNQAGKPQGQLRAPARLVACSAADDGSAYVAIGQGGEIWWLAPDLTTSWQRAMPQRAIAAAVDPFGQYVAVTDTRGNLHLFDRQARSVCQIESPRPLHHLAFVPAAPFLVGSADFGLVACFDLAGRWIWRDGLVAHVGSLAVSGDGEQIVLACYTEGLQLYALSGKKQQRQASHEPCRLSAISFDGRLKLVAGLSNRLHLQDEAGTVVGSTTVTAAPVALALGALGDSAFVAGADGSLMALEAG